MSPEKKAIIIKLANTNGIDTDTDGDIWGSENGSIFKFAEAVLSHGSQLNKDLRVRPPAPPPPQTRFVNDAKNPDIDSLERESYALDVTKRLLKSLKRKWLEFKYRNQDDDVCCCGSYMAQGGSICYHGGCRSMKEYVISRALGDD